MNTGLIITSVSIAVGVGEAKYLATQNKLSMRPVIGGFVGGLLLFAFDEASPDITKWLAVLVLVSALALNGNYLLDLVNKAIGYKK